MMNSKKLLTYAAAVISATVLTTQGAAMKTQLSQDWYFSRTVQQEYGKSVPADAKRFTLGDDGWADLDSVAGAPAAPKSVCVVYNTFTADQAETLSFGLSADWWCEVRLNGTLIYDTLKGGNGFAPVGPMRRLFDGKVKKGENLLAVKVIRGSVSWRFAFGLQATLTDGTLITVDPGQVVGPIKMMNAVNNGPIVNRTGDQVRSNVKPWKAAKIPMARNHDASFCSSYGGSHSVDVHAIFPDFSRDPDDPEAYDFQLTDEYVQSTLDAGTKVFYRLGSKIEHESKKYGTKVPPDFAKWARICEHIIRHYNEGWNHGFHHNIQYWEIWNEPDLDPDDSPNKRNWQGTEKEFFKFYRVAALHLKKCFPKLKIGGPALANPGRKQWMENFLTEMTASPRVPIDFFSWHTYATMPEEIVYNAGVIRKTLDRFGYTDTESILNEWNYVRGWTDDFIYSIETIIGLKGAAFTAAVMNASQHTSIDVLMYYDARPCVFNGLFDIYTLRPLKGYYPFLAWSKLADLGQEVQSQKKGSPYLYTVAAKGKDGKLGVWIVHYAEMDHLPAPQNVTLTVKGKDLSHAKLLRLDETRNLEEDPSVKGSKDNLLFTLPANTCAFVEL